MTAAGAAATPDRVRTVPMFASLGDDALERVSSVASEVDFPEGHVLIEPRQPGAGVFFILDGSVHVDLRSGRVDLGAGECVGELSVLVDDAARSVRVCAATPVRCLAIPRAEFEELLHADARVAVAVARALARRLLERVPR